MKTPDPLPERRPRWLCYHCIPKDQRKVTDSRGVNGFCDSCGEEDKLWAVKPEEPKE